METLRSKLLSANKFAEKLVDVFIPGRDGAAGETVKVLVRQPSLEQRNIIAAGGSGAASRAQVLAVISCVLDPGSKQPIFKDEDADALMAMPAGSFPDVLAAAVMEALQEGQEMGKAPSQTQT
mgnify:CR=1 FL=1